MGFLLTVLVVVVLVHLYLWKRLVADTTLTRTRARRFGTTAIVALAVGVPVTLGGSRAGPDWLAWGYLWIPVMFYLLVTLAALEIPLLAARWWLRRRTPDQATAAPAAPALATVGASDSATSAPTAAAGGSATSGHTVAAEGSVTSGDSAGSGAALDGPGNPAGSGDPAVGEPDPGRRLLLARGAAIFAGLTAVSVTGYGAYAARRPPSIDRVRVPLAKLPRRMDGFRIAVVSDIHLGPLAGPAHAERIVAAINGLDADLITIVGDLVDGTVEELRPAAAPLRRLSARHGAFFVTGNHEYYSGAGPWVDELPRLGVRVLQNARVEIDGLDLAGVNDLAGEEFSGVAAGGAAAGQAAGGMTAGPNFAAALGDRDAARPVVLLAHQPIQAFEAARHGVDLQLSGHTHGGQLMPFNLLVKLQQPIVSGLGEVDGTQVYVTNGAGFWGPPVRVGVPPQVSLVELRTA